jgi:hypothetical protein
VKVSEINKLKVKNNASSKVKSEKVSKKNTSGFYCIPYEKIIRGYIVIDSNSKKEAQRNIGCVCGMEEDVVSISVFYERVFKEVFNRFTPNTTFFNCKIYGKRNMEG